MGSKKEREGEREGEGERARARELSKRTTKMVQKLLHSLATSDNGEIQRSARGLDKPLVLRKIVRTRPEKEQRLHTDDRRGGWRSVATDS